MEVCKGCGKEYNAFKNKEYCYKCLYEFKDKPEVERLLRIRERDIMDSLWTLLTDLNPEYLLDLINESCMSDGCKCGGEDSYIVWQ
jgi:hypothetical protein